ncbi:MAG TPA: DUF3310 domain-containing protein [Steroidobacteraceae bacterium]|nr:DUF3310 domain-containing protein [Steroidobacteraceae bacterium]
MSKSKSAKLRSSKPATARKRPTPKPSIEELADALANIGGDLVNHPPHYMRGGLECVDIVEAMAEGWEPQTALRLGQAVQYVFRHAHKGNHRDGTQDLKKAIWWIQREIDARDDAAALI